MEHGRLHSVELLEMALAAARQLGYQVREDSFGGFPGGGCQIKGQKWLLVDPSLSPRERLQLVLNVLAGDPATDMLDLPPALARVVKHTHAA